MENLIYKITIGDWDYFTNTAEVSSLKKYGVNSKNIEKLIKIVKENMDGKIDLSKDQDNLGSKYKLLDLRILRSSIRMLMIHDAKVELFMQGIKQEFKPDPRIEDAIKQKIEEIKESFHFEIKDIEDLKMLDDEIRRRELKYKELNGTQVEFSTMTFSESIIVVFNALGYEKIDYNMVLNHFFILKDKAIKLNGTTK